MAGSRRRVRLGSGLDLRKLADTIAHLADSEGAPLALICNLARHADSWVHLSRDPSGEWNGSPCWKLVAGLPPVESAPTALAAAAVDLPVGARVISWEPGIFVDIALPLNTGPEALARLIVSIITSLHGVTDVAGVEVSMETL